MERDRAGQPDSGEEVPLCFCHGDYQYHNILRPWIFPAELRNVSRHGERPVSAVAKAFGKEGCLNGAGVLLAAYESVRPLKSMRQDHSSARPILEKLWKIVNLPVIPARPDPGEESGETDRLLK